MTPHFDFAPDNSDRVSHNFCLFSLIHHQARLKVTHLSLLIYNIYIYRYILAWMNNAIHLISLLWCSHAVFISHSRALGYQCIIIWYTACFSWRRRKRFRHICCVYVTDSASRCCLELTEGCLGLFSSFIFHFYSFKKQNACVSQEAFSCL